MFYKIELAEKEKYLHMLSTLERPEIEINFGDFLLYRLRHAPEAWLERRVHFNEKFILTHRKLIGGARAITVGDLVIGDGHFQCIAGPCAVESLAQLNSVADVLSTTKTHFIRGGAFKPRTSPYAFQGLGMAGLKMLREVGDRFGLKVVSEVMSTDDLEQAQKYLDVIQIGSRNMHNFSLLKRVGKLTKPVLLKRGFSATYEEFLLAAEYIMNEGNPNVILCERGIRAFQDRTRNTLDLAGVALLKQLTHLPIVVDPSHATGLASLVPVMAKAALVAGADGVMVEMHPDPSRSISDKAQALDFATYQNLVESLEHYASVEGLEFNPSCRSR